MIRPPSPTTQAILLLTAPLIAGRKQPAADVLSPGEYKRLRRTLHDQHLKPEDLLGPDATAAFEKCRSVVEPARLSRLMGRGFLLSQAIERWQARAIWVISRADYPQSFRKRLNEDVPPVLYGCGDPVLLEAGGLAVVGSRNASDALLEYAERIGREAAAAERAIVSGGARGVDTAAMRGALAANGRSIGVLPDSLERAAVARDYRDALIQRRLVLVSPYDPAVGFNAGHAMSRNKLIYALAEAALVVNADHGKGGTWAGAVEQLEKLRFVLVYVRSTGHIGKGLEVLQAKGALPWPNPDSPRSFAAALTAVPEPTRGPVQESLFSSVREPPTAYVLNHAEPAIAVPDEPSVPEVAPAEKLFAAVKAILAGMTEPQTAAAVAAELKVTAPLAQRWLTRLVKEGVLEKVKVGRHMCYRAVPAE